MKREQPLTELTYGWGSTVGVIHLPFQKAFWQVACQRLRLNLEKVLLWIEKLGRDANYGEKSLVVFLVTLCCSEVLFGNHLSLGSSFADE